MITIKSVKYNESKGAVGIGYLEYNDTSKSWDEKSLNSQETPTEEFKAALAALKPAVVVLAEFPKEWEKSLTVSGLSVTTKDERRTLVVKAHRSLANGRPLIVNTPATDLDSESDAGNEKAAAVIPLLDDIVGAARDYIAGHRAQASLDFDGKPVNPYGGRTAKGQGYDAAINGQGEHENPYSKDIDPNADAVASWLEGWCEGKKAMQPKNPYEEATPESRGFAAGLNGGQEDENPFFGFENPDEKAAWEKGRLEALEAIGKVGKPVPAEEIAEESERVDENGVDAEGRDPVAEPVRAKKSRKKKAA